MRAPLLSSAQLSVLSGTAHPGIARDAAAHCTARHLLLPNLPLAGFANLRAGVLHPVVAADLSGHSAKRIFETIMADVVIGHYKNGRRR